MHSYWQGKVPLVSTNALHQLHIFIFFLAVFHVLYSALTMTLGRLKVGNKFRIFDGFLWKKWISCIWYGENTMPFVTKGPSLQIRGWKEWETETASSEYDTTNGICIAFK